MSDEDNATESEEKLPEAVHRDLKNPYWEIRPADRPNESYLSGEAKKIVLGELDGVLPGVKVESLGDYQSRINYELEPAAVATLRELDSVPPSQLEAFRVAATKFYDKASEKDVSDYEALLRLSFRLPDPLRDRDAYRVYGEDFERHLVILWGCESVKGSAIPMVAHPRVPGSEKKNVHDILKTRLLGWEQMQKDALALLASSNESLSRFIGVPIYNKQQKLASVSVKNTRRDGKNFRPLRKIMWDEHAAFNKAAKDFYARSDRARSPYEAELRRRFRLPDPETKREFYLNYGSKLKPKLLCLCPPDQVEEESLCLTVDAKRGIPPLPEGEEPPPEPEEDEEWLDEKKDPLPTVAGKLRRWTVTLKHFSRNVAIVVGLLALAAAVFYWSLDKEPPRLWVKSRATDNLLLLANKPIQMPGGTNSIIVKAVKDNSTIAVTTTRNGATNINLALDRKLKDQEEVVVMVSGITDLVRFHPNTAKTNINYRFKDETPATMTQATGDGKNLDVVLVTFSEPVEKSTASTRANYAINGQAVADADLVAGKDNRVELRVFPTNRFVYGKTYTIVCSNIMDRAAEPNAIPASGNSLPFKFVDDVPPRLSAVPNTYSQFSVQLQFDEDLLSRGVTDTNNYVITNRAGARIPVYKATWETNVVKLAAGPLNGDLHVTVSGLTDRATNAVAADANSKAFAFKGEPDEQAPMVESVTIDADGKRLEVKFSEPVRVPPKFKLYPNTGARADAQLPTPMDVKPELTTHPVPSAAQFDLELKKPLIDGNYLLDVAEAMDVVGNALKPVTKPVDYYTDYIQVNIDQHKIFHDELTLRFNQPIDAASVNANSVKVPGYKVEGIRYFPDEYEIRVSLNKQLTGSEVIQVRNIRTPNSFINHSIAKYDLKSPR